MKFATRFQNIFRRTQLEAEMTEEMRHHIELQTELNVKAGMSPDEARCAALRQFGGVEQIKEIVREQRGGLWLDHFMRDLRFASRQLRKSPGFTFVAVATLALGIGVNAAVFTFVRDLVLRPLAQQKRQNLTAIYTTRVGPHQDFRSFSYGEFMTLRESREVFSDVTAWTIKMAAVGRRDEVKRSLIAFVPENFFQILDTQPLAGRFFSREEAEPGSGAAVVVANHAFWQRLGGRSDFVGSQIEVNGRSFTVVGIAPQGFSGVHSSAGPDVWLPLGTFALLYDTDLRQARTTELFLCGNRQPGLTLDIARTRLDVLDARLAALQTGDERRRLVLAPPSRFSLGSARPQDESFLTLFASFSLALSGAVLLVACLNLANMMYARGASRRAEIALRISLGASRGRVVRQLLVEGLLLALCGGTAGLLVSVWSGSLLQAFAQRSFGAGPFAMAVHPAVDWSLILVSAGLSVLAVLAFSLLPALRCTKIDVVQDLKSLSGDAGATEGWGRFFSLRHCLVMAQVALALMLVFCAGLFVRGAQAAGGRDFGFKTEGQVVANIDYSYAGSEGGDLHRRQAALLERARAFPGVNRAALASGVPFNFDLRNFRLFAAGAAIDAKDIATSGARAGYTAVSRGYFETLGIPLLRGRDFTETESNAPGGSGVAIIDEALARVLYPDGEALGRHLVLNPRDVVGRPEREIEIVGIVRSAHDDVFEAAAPHRLYRPLGQMMEPNTYLHLQIATSAAGADVLARVRRELREFDPTAPLLSLRPLHDVVDKNINLLLIRLGAAGFGLFGLVALVLSIIGVYGVKAYAVTRRAREIGIRLALGATPADVVKLILRQGLAQVTVATTAGLVLALIAGQLLSKMLYRIDPLDPILLAVSAGFIAAAALAACWLPARRATKGDPMVALRAE